MNIEVKTNDWILPNRIGYNEKIYKFLKFNSNIANLQLDNIEKGDTFDYSDYLKNHDTRNLQRKTNPSNLHIL